MSAVLNFIFADSLYRKSVNFPLLTLISFFLMEIEIGNLNNKFSSKNIFLKLNVLLLNFK